MYIILNIFVLKRADFIATFFYTRQKPTKTQPKNPNKTINNNNKTTTPQPPQKNPNKNNNK